VFYLLDTHHVVYRWSGKGASASLVRHVEEFARQYTKEAMKKRETLVHLVNVEQSQEPIDFIHHFHSWSKRIDILNHSSSGAPIHEGFDLLEFQYKLYKTVNEQEKKERDENRVKIIDGRKKKKIVKIDWPAVIMKELPEWVDKLSEFPEIKEIERRNKEEEEEEEERARSSSSASSATSDEENKDDEDESDYDRTKHDDDDDDDDDHSSDEESEDDVAVDISDDDLSADSESVDEDSLEDDEYTKRVELKRKKKREERKKNFE